MRTYGKNKKGNEDMWRKFAGKTGKRGIKRKLGMEKCRVRKRSRRLDERKG